MADAIKPGVEKGFAAGSMTTPGERAAHIISVIANPLFLALPLFLLVSWRFAPDLPRAFLWWAIIAAGFTLAPSLFISRGVKRGRYSDAHVSVREQRLIPLLFGLACMIAVFLLLIILQAARPLIATVTAALLALLVATAITQAKYKVSLHAVGLAGAITTCCLLISPFFLILVPLIVLVGWARYKVQAHTPLQSLLGVAIAITVTVVVFWLFHVL